MKVKKCHAFFVCVNTQHLSGTSTINYYHKPDGAGWEITRREKSFMRKNNFLLYCFLFFSAAFFGACSHEKLPTVSTGVITDISSTTATASGTVLDDGTDVIVRGLCYSFSDSLPSVEGLHTTDGNGPGVFSSQLSDLQPNTTYDVRAYATNSIGTAYGNTVKFTTLEDEGTELSNYAQMLCIPQGWIMSAAVSTPGYLCHDGTVVTNLFEGYLFDFETDDIVVFNPDGTIIANPGNLIPDYDLYLGEYDTDEFPHTTSVIGNWSFIGENEPPTEISMQIPFFYDRIPEECRIVSLSENEFVIKVFLPNEQTADPHYEFCITYVPANSEEAAKTKIQKLNTESQHVLKLSSYR